VGCHGGHVGIAGTPKNSNVGAGGLGGIKGGVWCRESDGFSREAVHKVGRSVKGLNLVNRRETRLEQKATQNVINGAKGTFRFPVLLRNIWTRHAECNTVGEEECAGLRIVEFTAVIALDTLDGGAKLCANMSKKKRKE
jgi:hypothetical protein